MKSSDILRYGAYLCMDLPAEVRPTVASAAVPLLAEELELTNEFEPGDGHPPDAIAYLRRVGAEPADIPDDGLFRADAVVHVASANGAIVEEFCAEMLRLLGPAVQSHRLGGVVRPTTYTGNAMHDFAYADQLVQESGGIAPNAFLMPMNKVPAWWEKDWMERHTYFLPRYDDEGKMMNQGHVLAAAAGITCLMRRTYKSESYPATDGAYDFVNYFECSDDNLSTFHEVCAALRDVRRNPEWNFVQEGPTWHGRRVATWSELFA